MKTLFTVLLINSMFFSLVAQSEKSNNESKRNSHFKMGYKRIHVPSPVLPAHVSKSFKNQMDFSQKVDSLLVSYYSVNLDTWIPDYKIYYEYNELGLITTYIDREWDNENSIWEENDRETYEHDANGNLSLYYDFDYDEASSEWVNLWKREYDYEKGLMVSFTDYERETSNGTWSNTWKVNFVYDENDLLTEETEWRYLLQWQEYWKAAYSYDQQGNLLTFNSQYYDSESNDWISDETENYQYNASNQLIEWSEKEWNNSDGIWEESDKEEYVYESNGDIILYVDYDWDEDPEEWELSWRQQFTYNPDFEYASLMLPWFFHDDFINFFNHQLLTFESESMVNNAWVPDEKGTYYYSSVTATNIVNAPDELIYIYPNPSNGHFNVLYENYSGKLKLEIHDLSGKLMISEIFTNGKMPQIERLENGLYLLLLYDDNNSLIHTQKISILK